MKPIHVDRTVKINVYGIVSDRLEGAIEGGVNRAFKHSDNPSREHIIESVQTYVMNEISELFDFGED